MDVESFLWECEVAGAYKSRIGDFFGKAELHFAKSGGVVFRTIIIRCDFHHKEGNVAKSDFAAPMLHHVFHQRFKIRAAYVALALIPNDALVGELTDWVKHCVVGQEDFFVFVLNIFDVLLLGANAVCFKKLLAHPRFHLGATIRRRNNADGYAERVREVFGKMPRRSRIFGGNLRRRHCPDAIRVLFEFVGMFHRHVVEPYVVLFAVGEDNLLVAVLNAASRKTFEWHLHIGLSRCQPNFADEDVAECQGFAV